MYTRCPECHTVFSLTPAQLKARGGMVRCGRCATVFRADEHLVKHAPKKSARAPKHAAVPGKAHRLAAGKARVAKHTDTAAHRGGARTATPLEPTLPPRTRTAFWIAGNTVLVLALLVQALYFYSYRLARDFPALQPLVTHVCGLLPCRRLPPPDIRLVDLAEAQVAPHPRYGKALRITATLVNRGEDVQPYPLMEVTLTDNQGRVVARRTYAPDDYQRDAAIREGLAPLVAVHVTLDITSPDRHAAGYEIRLLPAP